MHRSRADDDHVTVHATIRHGPLNDNQEAAVKELEDLIGRLNHLDATGQDRQELLEAAEELWEYPLHEEIKDEQLRDSYVLAMLTLADLMQNKDKYISALKRAYRHDHGHFEFGVKGSTGEYASYRLGVAYEQLGSYHGHLVASAILGARPGDWCHG